MADTSTRLALTPAERNKLALLSRDIYYDDVIGTPILGTAAALNTSDVLSPGAVTAGDVSSGVFVPERIPPVSSLRGFRSGTAVPSGGFDGEIYFQYS